MRFPKELVDLTLCHLQSLVTFLVKQQGDTPGININSAGDFCKLLDRWQMAELFFFFPRKNSDQSLPLPHTGFRTVTLSQLQNTWAPDSAECLQ